jgi:hypothetical protein
MKCTEFESNLISITFFQIPYLKDDLLHRKPALPSKLKHTLYHFDLGIITGGHKEKMTY